MLKIQKNSIIIRIYTKNKCLSIQSLKAWLSITTINLTIFKLIVHIFQQIIQNQHTHTNSPHRIRKQCHFSISFIINETINNSHATPMFTQSPIRTYCSHNFTSHTIRHFTLSLCLCVFLWCSSSAFNGHQPFGANQSVEVATAGLFLGNMQADPPQATTHTPTGLALPTPSRSAHSPADGDANDDVIRLESSDVNVEVDQVIDTTTAAEPVLEVREDIVLAEGWSPVLYKWVILLSIFMPNRCAMRDTNVRRDSITRLLCLITQRFTPTD